MNLNTLYPSTPTLVDDINRRQGRSRKQLRIRLTHDGRVFIARFEGRPGLCFGLTEKEAIYNLKAGAQWL